MIESFVDLTYRGLSLGRRVRLSQVRPSTGYLELAAPMPVGSRIAITAEDGMAFDAVVTAIHEQVGGSDRTPGMIVAPALVAEPVAAWWAARVSLPEDDSLRPRADAGAGRSRPVTVRPRAHAAPTPPPLTGATTEGPTDEVPTILSDLDARVAAAAGVAPRPEGDRNAMRTLVMPLSEIEALTAASADGEPDPASPPPADEMSNEGISDVIDDGKHTVIMQPVDPEALGVEPHAPARGAGSADPEPDRGDDGEGDDGEDIEEPPDTLKDAPTARPARGPRRRRSRR